MEWTESHEARRRRRWRAGKSYQLLWARILRSGRICSRSGGSGEGARRRRKKTQEGKPRDGEAQPGTMHLKTQAEDSNWKPEQAIV